MIDWAQAFFLALLQGATEFLPISSSAHLIIPSLLLDWPDQGLAFDVAVHVGTLFAVVIYYRQDLLQLLQGSMQATLQREANPQSDMVIWLAVASVPVALLGVWAGDAIEAQLRNLPSIAAATLLFALVLAVADRRAGGSSEFASISLRLALIIGCAQALALWPGVSRSGVTISAALLLGVSRVEAARFSFLLSIPVISGAGLLKALALLESDIAVNWWQLAFAVATAGLVAYLSIALFLRFLDRVGLMPFVYYRVALAAILFTLWLV